MADIEVWEVIGDSAYLKKDNLELSQNEDIKIISILSKTVKYGKFLERAKIL